MPKIDVCLTHELIQQHDLRGKIVVIVDVFRATSCMVAGLNAGITSIRPVREVADCDQFSALGYLKGGERHAQKIEGFELDNSPFSYMLPEHKGKKVVMTTTNGTLSIDKAKANAEEILAASFGNITATENYLRQKNKDVIVLCAGWKGRPGLEDVLFAGALASRLADQFGNDEDGTHMAMALYEVAKNDPLQYLQRASHLQRLKNLSGGLDIPFCLQEDTASIIVKLTDEELYAH